MANLTTHCQLYGESLYADLVYTEPCSYTGGEYFDFIFDISNLSNNNPVVELNWWLYRRDTSISTQNPINENHVLIDQGITIDNFIRISLMDYYLRSTQTDFLLVSYKGMDIGHRAYSYIRYYPDQYTQHDANPPYQQTSLYLAKETSSGGMGGSVVTHTEYRDKPLPKIRITKVKECLIRKEIEIINIKDFDNI